MSSYFFCPSHIYMIVIRETRFRHATAIKSHFPKVKAENVEGCSATAFAKPL